MRSTRSVAVRVIGATTALCLAGGAIAAGAAEGHTVTPSRTSTCARACVVAAVSTYLHAREHQVSTGQVPLDPRVSSYELGDAAQHAANGATEVRAALAKDPTRRIDRVEWVVDGDVAMVSYAGWTSSTSKPAYFVAQRFTLRDGKLWEILSSADAAPTTGSSGFPNTPISVVSGPPDSVPAKPDYDNGPWCSVQIAEHGDASLTAAEHRRCMIAIASTYVNAEENSQPGNQILFDPRFSRYSLGGSPLHDPSNSDLIRTQEGTYQGTYNRVIRSIKHREWTADGDRVWIVYQGWLVASTTHPGFYVAERFTIRNGLIWNIMIAPIATRIP